MYALALALAFCACACGRLGFGDHPPGSDAAAIDATAPDDSADDSGSGSGSGDPAKAIAGCVLHLAMDEAAWTTDTPTVVDSCNHHDGTPENGAVAAVDPVRGPVGHFVGGTSCITIPDAPDLRATTGLTLSAWVHPTALTTQGYGVISKRIDFGNASMYALFIWASDGGAGTTNEIYADIDTEDTRIEDTNTNLADGAWHQVTLTYDGTAPEPTRVRIYLDGNLTITTAELSSSITQPSTQPDLSIGCLPLSGPAQSLVGDLDDVALWLRPLTAAEVTTWFTASNR